MDSTHEEQLRSLFNSLAENSTNARKSFSQGSVSDSVHLLQEVQRRAHYLEQQLLASVSSLGPEHAPRNTNNVETQSELPGYLDQGMRQGRHSVSELPPYFRPQDSLLVDTFHGSSGMGPASAPVPTRRSSNPYQAHGFDPYSGTHRPTRRPGAQHTTSGYRPEPVEDSVPRRSSLSALRPYSPRHPSPPSGHPIHPPEDYYPRLLSAPRAGHESSRERGSTVSVPDRLFDPVPNRLRQSSLPHLMDYQYHDPPRHVQTGQHYFYSRDPAVHPLADHHAPRAHTYPGTEPHSHTEPYFSDAQTHRLGYDSVYRHTPHPPFHHEPHHYPPSHPPIHREGYIEQGESSQSSRSSSQGLVRGNQPYRPPTPFVTEDIHMPHSDGSLSSSSSRKVSLGSVHIPPLPPRASSTSSMPSQLVQAMSLSGPTNRGGGGGGMVISSRPSTGPTFIISRHDGTLVNSTGLRTQFHAPLEPEVTARLDELFFKFLQRICSDLNACDAKGDQIHQPLMAKKMQRLEASSEFRPFKFRIQAFTNAFHDSLIQHGLTEDILPLRKVKIYLWRHRYISRFNEDGKKQKSKGNHVWNIEARKITDSGQQSSTSTPVSAGGGGGSVASSTPMSTSSGGTTSTNAPSPVRWEFREYTSRIAGQLNKFAKVGVPYVYTPKIWDAQMSCPIAEYSSPDLPAWLLWHNGELRGTPGPDDESCTITIVAKYLREGENCVLEMAFPLTVSDPSKESELQDSGDEDEDELEDDDDEYPVATNAITGGSAQAVVVPAPIATGQVMLAQASEDVSPRRAWKTTEDSEDEPDVQNEGDVSEDIGDEDEDDDEDEEDESPSSRRASGGSGRKLLASTTERNDSKRRKQV